MDREPERVSWERLLVILVLTVGGLIGVLAFGREAVLGAIEDRRAAVYEQVSSSPLQYRSIWIALLGTQIASGLQYLPPSPDNLFAMILTRLFVALSALDTFGLRSIAAGFPIVLSSGMNMAAQNRTMLLLAAAAHGPIRQSKASAHPSRRAKRDISHVPCPFAAVAPQ